MLICHLNTLFSETAVHVFCSFSKWITFVLTINFWLFFLYSWYESFVRYVLCKHFLLARSLSFYLNSEVPKRKCLAFLKSNLLNFFFLLGMVLLVSGLKTFHQAIVHCLLCFFPKFLIILYLHLNLWLDSLLCEVWGLHRRSLFCYRFPITPTAFAGKTILLPLNNSCTFVKNQLGLFVWIYLWDLTSVLSICVPSSLPISHCLSYSGYLTCLSPRLLPSTLLFFSKTILEVRGPVSYRTNLRISLSTNRSTDWTKKYLSGILMGIALNRSIWGEMTF